LNRSIFQCWKPNIVRNYNNYKQIKSLNLNFGPQHPAAHGVLRLVLQLNGEVAERFDPHVGLLHRGSEKLIEDRIYLQGMPYFDRMDYVSMMVQEHAYCLAIESLLDSTNYTATFTQIRTLFDELTRILNHLLAIACHALDVGSMSSVFWAFEEREKIMEFYERVCGARMHAAFYRPNEVNLNGITHFLLEDILEFTRNFFTTLNEMHNILTYNKIWKQRLINIGVYSQQTCFDFGLSGVMARCTGLKRDIRLSKTETYANYYYLNFRSYIGQHGDCYDRFLIRMNEMGESLNIINQNISKISRFNSIYNKYNYNLDFFIEKKPKNEIRSNIKNIIKPHSILNYLTKKKKNNNYNSMESLINHFKYWSEGMTVKSGYTYQCVEAPKGEFGVTLLSDGSNKPYKCKIRSPAYHHLQLLPKIGKGHFLADIVALVGTVDIVFGEIDR
jgi:NADH:ubiquinone oxidoreductase subunit D